MSDAPLPPDWKRVTWTDVFCMLGMHDFLHDGLDYAGDGRQIVRTKCVHCDAVDHKSEVVGLRIERKGKR